MHEHAMAAGTRPARRPSNATGQSRSHRLAACLFGVVASVAVAPLLAEDGSRWTLRGYGVWLSPAGDEVSVVRAGPGTGDPELTTHTVSEDGTGLGLGLEFMWTPRIGVELGVLLVELDNDFRLDAGGATLTDTEPMAVASFALGVNWHLRAGRRLEVSLGAFVAQTTFDDVTFLTEAGRREKLAFDDDYGFGAKAAIDVPFGRQRAWSFSAELRYLATILESEVAGQDLAFDPLILAVGVGYRF